MSGRLLRALAPYLAFAYLSFVKWTTRLAIREQRHRDGLRARDRRFLYAFWHNRQIFFTTSHRGENAAILTSLSRDGDIVAKVLKLSRMEAARGSSSRGGSAALRAMMEVVAHGADLGITPDGPKGPVYEVKPGALFLAQKLGIPILPITNALSRKLVLKRSWDQYQVPLPFGRVVIRYGAPIDVGPGDDLRAKAAELKRVLDDITAQAESEIAG